MYVFPMAGLSKRFQAEGYDVPKYMLTAGGKTIFQRSVEGFAEEIARVGALFIFRDVLDTRAFIEKECAAMGLANYQMVELTAPTRGQAETVEQGLRAAGCGLDQPLTIFNIDTIRSNYHFPDSDRIRQCDGYLEVFQGSGDNWSFVRLDSDESAKVIETSEKVPISDLCCTGLYYFRRVGDFLDAFDEAVASYDGAREIYVAPLYNLLIRRGLDIRHHLIASEDVVFSGIPSEYKQLVDSLGG